MTNKAARRSPDRLRQDTVSSRERWAGTPALRSLAVVSSCIRPTLSHFHTGTVLRSTLARLASGRAILDSREAEAEAEADCPAKIARPHSIFPHSDQ